MRAAPTLFAGIRVRDVAAARAWYERLFGAEPSFLPNEVEAVWELAEHRYVYVEQDPSRAGHGLVTIFFEDADGLDDFVAGAARRGIEPTTREIYDNGVRKTTFHDPDGNAVGIGGPPTA